MFKDRFSKTPSLISDVSTISRNNNIPGILHVVRLKSFKIIRKRFRNQNFVKLSVLTVSLDNGD